MTDNEPNAPHTAVSRVAVKVPPFWPHDPELWFAQLEGQFLVNGITSDNTKYGYVIGSLEARYAAEVKDVIINPPGVGKYAKVKTELIARLSMSQEVKIRQLLEKEEVGDRKPSQFLRRLRDLGGNAITDSLLRTLWTGRLPQHLQAILAAQPDTSLDAAASLADRVLEVVPVSLVNETKRPQTTSTTINTTSADAGDLTTLCRLVSELQVQVGELQKQNTSAYNRSRSRYDNRVRNSSRSRSRNGTQSHRAATTRENTDDETVCFYHSRFGTNARKCRDPCSFNAGNARGHH